MNRSVSFSGIFLIVALFIWTNLPVSTANQMRSLTVAALSPAWHIADGVRNYLSDRPLPGNKKDDSLELAHLQLENYRLQSQIDLAKEWISYEKHLEHVGQFLQSSSAESRRSYLSDLLQLQSQALPGRVIYRDPSSWSNSLWISVGEEDNRAIGCQIISRNSPVVDGNALIGVVDYVGQRQSRVRLITDSGLTPAVRVIRGEVPHREITELIDALSERLQGKPECTQVLAQLKEMVGPSPSDLCLAKGELRGSGASFWRSHPVLKGIGFNYDYPDAEGPARDLRTGRPLTSSGKPVTLIQEGDLLVTSGFDGVFPPGLSVAVAKKVFPLKQGGFAYELEAVPAARALNALSVVFVLPSLSGD